jgi:hypothetical protein
VTAPRCDDAAAPPGRRTHAWLSTGLHIVKGHLCNTRRCVWCGQERHKRYGAKSGWTVTP